MRAAAASAFLAIVLAGCAAPAAEVEPLAEPPAVAAEPIPLDRVEISRAVRLAWSAAPFPDTTEPCGTAVGAGVSHSSADPTAASVGPGSFHLLASRADARRLVVEFNASDPAVEWSVCIEDLAVPVGVTGASPLVIEAPLSPGDEPALTYHPLPDPTRPVVDATLRITFSWWPDPPAAAASGP